MKNFAVYNGILCVRHQAVEEIPYISSLLAEIAHERWYIERGCLQAIKSSTVTYKSEHRRGKFLEERSDEQSLAQSTFSV